MVKKILLLTLCISFIICFTTAYAQVYTCADSNFSMGGKWNESELGYSNINSKWAMADAETWASWRITDETAPYRFYYWVTLDEAGDTNAKITFGSETQEISKYLDFSQGASGWRELGIFECGNAGSTLRVTGTNGKKLMASAIKIEKLSAEYGRLTVLYKRNPECVLMKTGCPVAYVGGMAVPKMDVAPEVINDSTMVPLRFVSENMGGEVFWNGETSTATVKINGIQMDFVPNTNTAKVNGTEKALVGTPIIKNGRTLVPLRFISEEAGMDVFWDESGVIVIGEELVLDKTADAEMILALASILDNESKQTDVNLIYADDTSSDTANEKYSICTFKNDMPSAVTFTFDDGDLGPAQYYDSLFEKYGFKGTAMVIADNVKPNLSKWQALVGEGRIEIGNHSMSHKLRYNEETVTKEQLEADITDSYKLIKGWFPKEKLLTFAAPWGRKSDLSSAEIAKNHYANGGVNTAMNAPASPSDSDWLNLPRRAAHSTETSVEDLNGWIDEAIEDGKWLIELWHGIAGTDTIDAAYNLTPEAYDEHLSYAAEYKDKAWFATFNEATMYIKERQSAKLNLKSDDADKLVFELTDGMDDAVFNYPLTIKVYNEFASDTVEFSQGNVKGNSKVLSDEFGEYVLIDAIPDSGDITVLK